MSTPSISTTRRPPCETTKHIADQQIHRQSLAPHPLVKTGISGIRHLAALLFTAAERKSVQPEACLGLLRRRQLATEQRRLPRFFEIRRVREQPRRHATRRPDGLVAVPLDLLRLRGEAPGPAQWAKRQPSISHYPVKTGMTFVQRQSQGQGMQQMWPPICRNHTDIRNVTTQPYVAHEHTCPTPGSLPERTCSGDRASVSSSTSTASAAPSGDDGRSSQPAVSAPVTTSAIALSRCCAAGPHTRGQGEATSDGRTSCSSRASLGLG